MRRAPNLGVNRSAKQLRCLVPVALRAPAPGYGRRWAERCHSRDARSPTRVAAMLPPRSKHEMADHR
jgi:hypothetical protein